MKNHKLSIVLANDADVTFEVNEANEILLISTDNEGKETGSIYLNKDDMLKIARLLLEGIALA